MYVLRNAFWNVWGCIVRGNQIMTPNEPIKEKPPPEIPPAPNRGFVWSPVTKRWYDKQGQPVYD